VAAVFASLLPVFLLILTGALLRRFAIRGDRPWLAAERLVYYVLFPVLLMNTLVQARLDQVPIAGVGGVLAAAILVMLGICFALRPVLSAGLAVNGAAFTSVVQGATRWNTTLALAVVAELYADRGLAIATVAAVTMIPLLNIANVWVLAHHAAPPAVAPGLRRGRQRTSWGRVLQAIALNPFIWSCALGFALNVISPPIPEPVYAVAGAVSQATLPLGLLLVGAGLRLADLIRLRPATLIATTLKMVAMPVIAIALSAVAGLSGTTFAVVACCASVPSASNSYVLARQMGGDAPLMAEILTMQTIVAVLTMPIVIAVAPTLSG
jgi:hypothetical protein